MWWIIIGSALGTLVVGSLIVVAGIAARARIIRWLAKNNNGFTIVEEGRAKIVVVGGAFSRVLMQRTGYMIDWDGDIVTGGQPIGEFGGIQRFGIPFLTPNRLIYSFPTKRETGGEQRFTTQLSVVDDVYIISVERAPDQNLIRVKMRLGVTIRIVNPKKALFDVVDWLEVVTTRVQGETRDVVTQHKYEDWVEGGEDIGQVISAFLNDRGTIQDLKNLYGVEIINLEVLELMVEDQTYADSILQRVNAVIIAEAAKTKADGEAVVVDIKAQAEAKALKTVAEEIKAQGDLGTLVRLLEALEKSPAGIAGVHIIPGLAERLRELVPGVSS